MTDQRKKQKTSALPQAMVEQPVSMNVPILAYSNDHQTDSQGNLLSNQEQRSDVYSIQVKDAGGQQSHLTSNNVSDFRRNQNSSVQSQPLGQIYPQMPSSMRSGDAATPDHRASPEKIFDPKPPAVKQPLQGNNSNSGQQQQPPVQNVFQFNLRVNNNNMHGGGVLVSGDAQAQVQASTTIGSQKQTTTTKSRSRDRRPASSKHANHSKTAQKEWQAQSHLISQYQQSQPQNAYFGASNQPRRVIKKRPMSANRKTLTANSIKANSGPTTSFKSPIQTYTLKKQNLQQTNGSVSSQKQRLIHYQKAQSMMNNGANLGGALPFNPSNEGLQSEQSSLGTTGNMPLMIGQTPFQPYTKSMKVQNQLGATTKTFSANKASHNPTSIFGSPDMASRIKSKIPMMTLQSREDLYEQNMQTKIEINTLRSENRKINTKMLVLENQLAQKDKLFEDMYKAAFQQVRLPMTHTPSSGAQPQANMMGNNAFYPAGVAQSTLGSSMNTQKMVFASSNAPNMTNQAHAQAQQLINSYKRTIREQSKELDKRDIEIEQVKRSVKMTQINQVLVENEAYRNECIRLREQLEQALIWHQQLVANAANQVTEDNSQSVYQLGPKMESATETFKRAPMSQGGDETVGLNARTIDDQSSTFVNEVRSENDRLVAEVREQKSKIELMGQRTNAQDSEISQLKKQLTQANQALQQEQQAHQNQNQQKQEEPSAKTDHKNEELISELQVKHQAQVSELETQIDKLKKETEFLHKKLDSREIYDEVEDENIALNSLEEQLAIKNQEFKDIEKEIDNLVMQNQKGVRDLQKMEQTNDTLLKKLQTQELSIQSLGAEKVDLTKKLQSCEYDMKTIMQENQELIQRGKAQDVQVTRSTNMAQERASILIEVEDENDNLKKELETLKAQMKTIPSTDKIKDLEQELLYKNNSLEAQKFDYEKILQSKEQEQAQLKQKLVAAESRAHQLTELANYQSPPVAPGRRRSTKKSAKGPATGRSSAFGESSFDRAPESDFAGDNNHPTQPAKLGNNYSEDRSDLGFSSEDDAEPAPLKESSEGQSRVAKICVNDKTIFGVDGLPLSPKDITADSPSVKEGFTRLRHACQVNFIRHDMIENFLFGKDYKPESKLSIRKIKEASMDKMQMSENAALDFARYLIEQGGSTITLDEGAIANRDGLIMVDQDRTSLAVRVVMFIMGQIQAELVYFRPEKEEKMKLIIGEKLQEAQNKARLLSVIQIRCKSDQLTFDEVKSVFDQSKLAFTKETMQCCFIFLLKKHSDLLRIRKADLVQFIHISGKKAHDFTMTGSRFPMETELVYSSDSEEDPEDPASLQRDETYGRTMKSLDATAGKNLISEGNVPRQKSSDEANQAVAFRSEPEPIKALPMNVQASGAVPNHQQLGEEEESSDDEFGANESRSEYSAPQIQEEIQSEADQSQKLQEQLLQQPQTVQGVMIDESLNDRADLESSIAHTASIKGATSVPATASLPTVLQPLNAVIEAAEKEEKGTIEQIQEQEPTDIRAELKPTIQKSRTLQDNTASIQYKTNQTDPDRPHNQLQRGDSQPLSLQSSTMGSKGRKTRPRPVVINIDVMSIKSGGSRRSHQSLDLTKMKKAPNVNVEDQDFSGSNGAGSSNLTGDMDLQLQPLKPDVPPPFGITVVVEQHSEYCHSPEVNKRGESDDLLAGSVEEALVQESTPEKRVNSTKKSSQEAEQSEKDFGNFEQDVKVQEQDQIEDETPSVTQGGIRVKNLSSDVSDPNYTLPKPQFQEADSPKFNFDNNSSAHKSSAFGSNHKPAAGAINHLGDISLPSASRLNDDSFGQVYQPSQASAEKPKTNLPPLELHQLKVPTANPSGIQVGELLTDRSARPGDEILDFKAGDGTAEKDSEDYTEDDDDDDFAPKEESKIQDAIPLETPEQLKFAMQGDAEGQKPLSAIKEPPRLLSDSNPSEIEEDYEF